jgi:hypothetical protein
MLRICIVEASIHPCLTSLLFSLHRSVCHSNAQTPSFLIPSFHTRPARALQSKGSLLFWNSEHLPSISSCFIAQGCHNTTTQLPPSHCWKSPHCRSSFWTLSVRLFYDLTSGIDILLSIPSVVYVLEPQMIFLPF